MEHANREKNCPRTTTPRAATGVASNSQLPGERLSRRAKLSAPCGADGAVPGAIYLRHQSSWPYLLRQFPWPSIEGLQPLCFLFQVSSSAYAPQPTWDGHWDRCRRRIHLIASPRNTSGTCHYGPWVYTHPCLAPYPACDRPRQAMAGPTEGFLARL